jgi:DNA processing protein
VAEAARNSGALITADFALEQGREVFALPGELSCATSLGSNGLIKQGAKLVTDVDDILEEFLPPLTAKRKTQKQVQKNSESDFLDAEENRIYTLISEDSVQLDELIEKTNLAIPKISDILFRLQLKRLVRQLPGKQFIRN